MKEMPNNPAYVEAERESLEARHSEILNRLQEIESSVKVLDLKIREGLASQEEQDEDIKLWAEQKKLSAELKEIEQDLK